VAWKSSRRRPIFEDGIGDLLAGRDERGKWEPCLVGEQQKVSIPEDRAEGRKIS